MDNAPKALDFKHPLFKSAKLIIMLSQYELSFFLLIFIFRTSAFSQSDFQKGPELNKQIHKEDMHIYITT